MKHKYKIGDLVKIVNPEFPDDPSKNKIGKIVKIDTLDRIYPYEIEFKNTLYNNIYNAKEIELYSSTLKISLKKKGNKND